jgi:diguanylate cyclase (GGDEF)-like protein
MAESKSSILIVDDDAEDLGSVERSLRSLPCELVTLKDPHQVISSVDRLRPDVVILDALLPGLSGFDLCKQIKTDPQHKATQVLILTGVYLRQQYRNEALQQFKADGYLTKPFRPPELQRLVVQLLARKTKTPSSRLLKKIGLPPAEPRKKGLLGRLFGRAEEEEPATVRIAPAPRESPRTPVAEPVAHPQADRVADAPASVLEPPRVEAPPAVVPPPGVEVQEIPEERREFEGPVAEVSPVASASEEQAPVAEVSPVASASEEQAPVAEVSPVASASEEQAPVEVTVSEPESASTPENPLPEPLPEPSPATVMVTAPPPEPESPATVMVTAPPLEPESPETIAVFAPPPEPESAGASKEPAPSPIDVVEVSNAGEATQPQVAEEEPRPSTLLDAPSSGETEEVTWIEADSKTKEMTLEEAAARATKPAPAETLREPQIPAPVLQEPEPEPAPAHEAQAPAEDLAETAQPMRRPRFRVGEVPIYDEPDFMTELKRELSKCKRVDRPLTLILIRVSDLGQIIELFGKDFREPVLWHIAEQAMESLREVDLVGMMSSKDMIAMTAFASDRYGGGRIVSRMRQGATRKPFRVGEELPPIIPVLDFGMATFPADGSEAASLLRRAEEDMANAPSHTALPD